MPGAVLAAPAATGPAAETAEREEKRERPGKRKRAVETPEGFESTYDFLEEMRTLYARDLEADEQNRKEGVLDARFFAGEQWDSEVKRRRDAASKPSLTINRIPAFVAQLAGNRRLNDIGIRVIPDSGGDRKVAEIREGLIRSIQKESKAQHAYDNTFDNTVIRGIGNFKISLDYAHDDVFEQDIRILPIPNPDAVVWDAESVEPSGSDAAHVFVVDRISRKAFERRFPDASPGEFDASLSNMSGWNTSDGVQIVSYWRMLYETRELALLKSGEVVDVTDMELEAFADQVQVRKDGTPYLRQAERRYACMYLCSATDILAGPYKLPIQRVPVFRVPGWEMFIEGDRIRWGLVRFLRDPQRLHNYWRSTIAEKLVASPKNKWVAPTEAVEGIEDQWRKSHLSDDPLLTYHGTAGVAPQRMPPIEMEPALIEQAGVAAQDLRDVSNIHEANLGIQSNEVSGKAIMARQRVGEVGTVIYQDNLNAAIEEAGRVINQLIPTVYDTPRLIKVLGKDMLTEQQVPINGDDPESVDITLGKYTISIVTGPSYATRRVEAREEMMGMVNAMPEHMASAADLIIEAQDWPGAEKIAERIRSQLPPGMIGPDEMSPEEAQAQQAAAAKQAEIEQMQMQMQMQGAQAELAEKQASAALKLAQAEKAEAEAREALAKAKLAEASTLQTLSEIETDRARVSLEAADRLELPKPASSAKDNG